MKAIRVTVNERERIKVPQFIRTSQEEDLFLYQTGGDVFVVVAQGDCSLGYLLASIECVFAESVTIETLR